jgi:hypothetical protein
MSMILIDEKVNSIYYSKINVFTKNDPRRRQTLAARSGPRDGSCHLTQHVNSERCRYVDPTPLRVPDMRATWACVTRAARARLSLDSNGPRTGRLLR